MGSFTNFLENELLDHLFQGGAYTRPATLYVGLFTVSPSDAGGGTEVAGNAYARQAMNTWSVASGGSTANSGADVTFPVATPSGWGTVNSFAIFDAVSAGNMLAWGALGTSKTIDAGDQAIFSAGDVTITLD